MELTALSAEFPRSAVHWRVQGKPYERSGSYSAMALAYIDARDVMDRLDSVCGPGGWQSEITETTTGRVLCRLGIFIEGQWVWKTDGAGGTAVEAEKGGISDALKRAAVSWGVGRYLYRLSSPWVACTVNDKGAWKAWTEDPWSKVKGLPRPEPEQHAFNAVAARDRIKAKYDRATVSEEVESISAVEKEDIARLYHDDRPKFNEVKKAKDDAIARLSEEAE